MDDLVERPDQYDEFDIQDGGGQVARSWVNLFGAQSGDVLDHYFYEPDGDEYAHWTWTTGQIRYGWWIASIGLPTDAEPGLWTVDARLNGDSLYGDSFLVYDSSAVPEPSGSLILVLGFSHLVFSRRRRRPHRHELARYS